MEIQNRDLEWEAKEIWDFAKKIGIFGNGSIRKSSEKLIELERRDREERKMNEGCFSGKEEREIRRCIAKDNVEFLCIQETKLEDVDRRTCLSIWKNEDCAWRFKKSDGASGELLCIWDKSIFSEESYWDIEGAMGIQGKWGKEERDCEVINVYAPCNHRKRKELWTELLNRFNQDPDRRRCIVGDFNSIRKPSERKGNKNHEVDRDMAAFNTFIDEAKLIDLPLARRRFTWIKSNESYMSRLDRFLISVS
ncbi:hypothetical protein DH2020_029987 [Rehmannia glutinosa]|uniref:Endonuclease/exonuclease/phosphatase domain-containing protein n=1 Tax=Rehmannia glutinosa TaxID=99300 RepID=A0ABR0VPY0_REHGL